MNEIPNVKVEFNVNGLKWVGSLLDVANLNFSNINQELCDHSGRFGYFSALLAQADFVVEQAENEVTKAKDNRKQVLGEVVLRIKQQEQINGKPPTDPMAEAMAMSDKAYLESTQALYSAMDILAQRKCDQGSIKAFVKTLEHKKECMIQLSNNLRHEQKETKI